MKAWAEIAGFAGLAAALHLGAFAMAASSSGAGSAGGTGGADRVTLAAASPGLVARVAEWTRPPAIATATATAPDAPQGDAPPSAPAPDTTPAPMAAPVPAALPAPEAAPKSAAMAPPEAALPEMPDPATRAAEAAQPAARPAPRPKRPATPPPAPAAEAAPALNATGNANTDRAGAPSAATAAPAADGDGAGAPAALVAWQGRILAAIERKKRYPRDAAGATGRATVEITLGRNGALSVARLTQSSGNAALDAAALRAVTSARLPKAPEGLTQTAYSFRFRMVFDR